MKISSFNCDTYYRDNFAVAFTQNLKSGCIDKMMNLANKLIKSTKAEDRLEGYFLKQMYSSENHQANLLKERQAVLGRSVNKDEMRTLSFAKWSM